MNEELISIVQPYIDDSHVDLQCDYQLSFKLHDKDEFDRLVSSCVGYLNAFIEGLNDEDDDIFEEKYDVIQPLGIQIYKNIYNETYIADVTLNDETYRNEPNIVARYESNLDVIVITGKYNGNYVQFTTYDPDCPLIEYVKMCANWEID